MILHEVDDVTKPGACRASSCVPAFDPQVWLRTMAALLKHDVLHVSAAEEVTLACCIGRKYLAPVNGFSTAADRHI